MLLSILFARPVKIAVLGLKSTPFNTPAKEGCCTILLIMRNLRGGALFFTTCLAGAFLIGLGLGLARLFGVGDFAVDFLLKVSIL